jgi:homoserine dehydrogenase
MKNDKSAGAVRLAVAGSAQLPCIQSGSERTLGYGSSGTSPGRVRTSGGSLRAPALASVHLFGAGKVGRAFLRRLAGETLRLVAATDSKGTVFAREGLDARALADHKERGGSLDAPPDALAARHERLSAALAADFVAAGVAAVAIPTDARRARDELALVEVALRAGSRVALASKGALALAADELLGGRWAGRVGACAALGGTGRRFAAELGLLRASCASVALVANATTTAVIEALEEGLELEQGLERARELGLAEADASSDLDGTDAALKLAAVARALWSIGSQDPLAIPRASLRELDPGLARARARRGSTTRLVARAGAGGTLEVALEELPRGSPLAVGPERVAYAYDLGRGETRVHLGSALGAQRTARALHSDVLALAVTGGAR